MYSRIPSPTAQLRAWFDIKCARISAKSLIPYVCAHALTESEGEGQKWKVIAHVYPAHVQAHTLPCPVYFSARPSRSLLVVISLFSSV